MVFLLKVGIVAAFSTLAFIGTIVIRIPIPAKGGYFNLGDTFVFVSAILYGPYIGFFVGLIGPSLADALGFPQFVIATAVVKGIEGLLIGLIVWKSGSHLRVFAGLALGVFVLVSGYFIFEAFIYTEIGKTVPFFAVTDYNAAIAEIFPNLIQGCLSAVLALSIWKVFQGAGKK